MIKLQTLAALAAGIALTGVAFVLAIGAFDTNHAAARAADVDADLLNNARRNFHSSRAHHPNAKPADGTAGLLRRGAIASTQRSTNGD
jgi:hypothetical protein